MCRWRSDSEASNDLFVSFRCYIPYLILILLVILLFILNIRYSSVPEITQLASNKYDNSSVSCGSSYDIFYEDELDEYTCLVDRIIDK